jgi:hypothetical protein
MKFYRTSRIVREQVRAGLPRRTHCISSSHTFRAIAHLEIVLDLFPRIYVTKRA